jgi:hypothetical protein
MLYKTLQTTHIRVSENLGSLGSEIKDGWPDQHWGRREQVLTMRSTSTSILVHLEHLKYITI